LLSERDRDDVALHNRLDGRELSAKVRPSQQASQIIGGGEALRKPATPQAQILTTIILLPMPN